MSQQTCRDIVSSTFVVALLTWAGVASCSEEDEKVIQRLVSWPSESGPSPGGFHLTYLQEDGLEELLFFQGSDGSRLLLTSNVEPSHGTTMHTLRDDDSGWWIRLGTKVEATGDTLHEFFQNVYADEDLLQELWLETAGGVQVRVAGPAHGGPGVAQHILTELERHEAVAELSRTVPAPLRQGILFLAGSLAAIGGAVEPGPVGGRDQDPLLELLSKVLSAEGGDAALRATPMVLVELKTDAEASFAGRDELLGRFHSVPLKVRRLSPAAPSGG